MRFIFVLLSLFFSVQSCFSDQLTNILPTFEAYVQKSLSEWQAPGVSIAIVKDGQIIIVDEFTGRPCPDRTWREGLHQAVETAAGIEITEENASEATITRPAYFRLYGRVCGMTGTAAEAASELRSTYHLRVGIVPLHRECKRIELPDRIFKNRAALAEQNRV